MQVGVLPLSLLKKWLSDMLATMAFYEFQLP